MLSVDALLVGAACLIPTVSHLLSFPLYMLNPMLALLLVGLLVGNDWRNALLLAVLLPLASCLVAGMPTAPKMVCMMAELATVATLWGVLHKRWSAPVAILAAIAGGKVVYYLLKAVVIAPAVLVGTHWAVQLATVVVWGGLFALLCRKK